MKNNELESLMFLLYISILVSVDSFLEIWEYLPSPHFPIIFIVLILHCSD